jgi:hypothetical protein
MLRNSIYNTWSSSQFTWSYDLRSRNGTVKQSKDQSTTLAVQRFFKHLWQRFTIDPLYRLRYIWYRLHDVSAASSTFLQVAVITLIYSYLLLFFIVILMAKSGIKAETFLNIRIVRPGGIVVTLLYLSQVRSQTQPQTTKYKSNNETVGIMKSNHLKTTVHPTSIRRVHQNTSDSGQCLTKRSYTKLCRW